MSRSSMIRRIVGASVFALLVASVGAYVASRDPLPATIRIAAGRPNGLFHEAAQHIARRLARRLGRPVRVVDTEGSIENATLVREGRADLALVQATRETLAHVSSIAPLYSDVYVVLARKGRGITRVADFAHHPIAIGRPGSGVHRASVPLLARHGVRGEALVARPQAIGDLLTDPTLDGGIVVTGLLNPEVASIARSGQFDVVTVEDADAIDAADPFLQATDIPPGMFVANPLVPDRATSTIASTAVLVVAHHAPGDLVEAALQSVYEDDLVVALPTLIPADDARGFGIGRMHPAARAYQNPYEGMDVVSDAVQAVDAGKELLVALGAAIYLVVERVRRNRAKAREQLDLDAANALDVYLEKTVAIEREQLTCTDAARLAELADEVTRVKLDALSRLASENLRSDRRFHIFLTQCASLVSAIELRIARLRSA